MLRRSAREAPGLTWVVAATDLAVSGVLAGLAAVLALALRQGRPDQLRGAGPSGDTGTAASGPAS
ncbi:hypothetical protein AB0395_47010 [Streptosporangium sp. NPDC051023]|uniref:hypothetical protein n=1 Tax=Streptosporangium sp. NPDC051023 TaxID=3155410 RepID=UPI00344E2952